MFNNWADMSLNLLLPKSGIVSTDGEPLSIVMG